MEDAMSSSNEKEMVVDIEGGKVLDDAQVNGEIVTDYTLELGQRSLMTSCSSDAGVNSDGIVGGSPEYLHETLELLVDKNSGEQQSQGLVMLAKKDHRKERWQGGKVKKAAKPPRPPNGPTLNVADMRLIKDITEIAMKKRERIDRNKLKKMQAARASSQSMTLSPPRGSTIFAAVITVLFLFVLIFQGFHTNSSSNLALMAAPLPAPEIIGISPVQLHKAAFLDDGSAPSFIPSNPGENPSGPNFSSPEKE